MLRLDASLPKPVWAGAALGAVILAAAYLQFTADDAFISFRYGKNLAEEGVWNWDPSAEVRVEAYTSPLYTALSVIPHLIGSSPVIFFKLSGLCLLVFHLWRIYRLPLAARGWLTVLCALCPFLYIHALSGLETLLFAVLLFEALLCFDRDGLSRPASRLAWLLLTLALVRPEGAVFAAGFFLHAAYRAPRECARAWPHLLAVALLGGLFLAWKLWLFGSLLPTSYYVKSASLSSLLGMSGDLEAVRMSLYNFQQSRMYLLFIGGLWLLASRRSWVLLGPLLVVYLVAYLPATLYMNFADRFFFQVFYPYLVAAPLFSRERRHGSLAVAALAGLVVWTLTFNLLWPVSYARASHACHVDLGRRLAPWGDGRHSMLLGDIGAIPYYSGWHSYDYIGLGDPEVARKGLTRERLEEIRPDLILLYAEGPDPSQATPSFGAGLILDYLRESGEYEFVAASRFSEFYLHAHLRRGLGGAAAIREALEKNALNSEAEAASEAREWLERYLRLFYLL